MTSPGKPTFAVVVPTYNEAENIERLLKSIRSQTESRYSIAVVDQGSTDKTTEIARSYKCIVIQAPPPQFYSPPSRSRNIGARSIEGNILLHLDADMELGSPDFLTKLAALFDDAHRAVVITELDIASGFWANCKAVERSCYRETDMEAARAVTRELFAQVGGYDEDISSGEDFFITRLYERETGVTSDRSLVLRHHIGPYSLESLLRKKFAYGRTATTYLRKARLFGTRPGASIVMSSLRAYLKHWRLIFKQPVPYLCIFPLRALELGAVGLGMWFGRRTDAVAKQVSD